MYKRNLSAIDPIISSCLRVANGCVILPCALLLCSLFGMSQGKITGFRASGVKVDITPSNSQNLLGYGARMSTGIHDHLYHRIVIMDDGETQFILISSDLGAVSPSEYDKVVAVLKEKLGVDPANVWWAVTHTHSAPEVGPSGLVGVFLSERFQHQVDPGYTTMVEEGLIKGVEEARSKLAPARLGAGWGFSQANINRRAIDTNGIASLGMNPDGAVDRRIGLLRIDKEDGSPLALLANYPIHGTVLSGINLEVSGDAPGIVSEYVERTIGAPMLFINGAAGNLAPLYSGYPSPGAAHLGEFRVLLGDKIIAANKSITVTTNTVKLLTGSLIVETPRKAGMGWSPDLAKYTRTTASGVNMIRLPVRFLKINNDLAIWSTPSELFCEVANEIRDRSPFPFTFYYGYTNGWLGYLPTAAEWEHAGYETTVSPYTPGAAKELTESVLGYLLGEMRTPPDTVPR
jgi:neutral ceramidase